MPMIGPRIAISRSALIARSRAAIISTTSRRASSAAPRIVLVSDIGRRSFDQRHRLFGIAAAVAALRQTRASCGALSQLVLRRDLLPRELRQSPLREGEGYGLATRTVSPIQRASALRDGPAPRRPRRRSVPAVRAPR